jgi:hypothetical protein
VQLPFPDCRFFRKILPATQPLCSQILLLVQVGRMPTHSSWFQREVVCTSTPGQIRQTAGRDTGRISEICTQIQIRQTAVGIDTGSKGLSVPYYRGRNLVRISGTVCTPGWQSAGRDGGRKSCIDRFLHHCIQYFNNIGDWSGKVQYREV